MKSAIVLLLAAFVSMPALAGPYVEAAKNCIADNTTGKDRKNLARWIFINMSVHPEIEALGVVPDEVREQTNKTIGELTTRLVTESCVNEFKAASQNGESELAITGAFEFLGVLAMQELMSNPDVSAAFEGIGRYVDQAKISAALAP